jgi:hypothetical protein
VEVKASEIRKILKLAKQFGVKELSLEGFTVQFFEKQVKRKEPVVSSFPTEHVPTHSPDTTLLVTTPDLTSEGIPTEDELLLMSTPFYDQIQELKRMKREDEQEEATLTQ